MTLTPKGNPSTTVKRKAKAKRASYRHGNLREALVTEAIKMMEERSDSAFTLREVAQRMRVSHSAAYRHFPSKGALLAEIARRGFTLLTEVLRPTLIEGRSAEDIVYRQAQAYVRTARAYPAHFRCMFGPRSFTEDEARAVDEACDESFACLNEAALQLIGSKQDSAATRAAALALWSVVHGLAHLAVDRQLCDFVEAESDAKYEALVDNVVAPLVVGLSRSNS
jgi:AcrR family transcriptional regulator